MEYLDKIGSAAVKASGTLAKMSSGEKNKLLMCMADFLEKETSDILTANEQDITEARLRGMSEALIDRLSLNEARIKSMADGVRNVAGLKDPVGEVLSMEKAPNGMMIGKKIVPLGVVGIIYESRPNVTSDAASLCIKAGNAVILRGGSDAIKSNIAVINALKKALSENNVDLNAIQLIEDISRETVTKFMKLNEYVDVLIPRGGAGLIRSVVENSTVPVIETGTGNCHIFVDETADFDMALNIIINAKTQRLGVCNAAESLVIHSGIMQEFLPALYERLSEKRVEIRADERARAVCPKMSEATEDDFGREYLDRIISLKTVDSIDEAIEHINRYNTGHSEAIITKSYENAMRFTNEVDAAAVYVNASTRFTDGTEFGLGTEIGISTQKLHARGPMGLNALTTTKYIIFGNGQIRQ